MNEKKLSSGIAFILIGIVILMINFGLIDWSILSVLFVLWPLIFVIIGMNIMFARYPLVKAATWIIFVVVILYFTINIDDYPFIKKSQFNYFVPITYDNVKLAEHLYQHGGETHGEIELKADVAAEVTIDALDDSEAFASIWVPDGNTRITETMRQDTKRLMIDQVAQDMATEESGFAYRMHLNPEIEWTVKIKTGILGGDLDFSELLVKSLSVETGAGDIKLQIDRVAEDADITIKSGIASVDLGIDEAVGVAVVNRAAISDNNFKDGWRKDGDTYYSDNYESADSKATIYLESGISSVDIHH